MIQILFFEMLLYRLDKEAVIQAAEHVARLLNDERLTGDLRWLWMGDYAETMARCVLCLCELSALLLCSGI